MFTFTKNKTLIRKPYLKRVKLKLNKTLHLICQARINGVKARLLIDTGASSSCIALEEQQRFDLTVDGDSFEAAGAGQGKMKAIPSQKCTLIIGRYRVEPFAFILLEMCHINATLQAQNAPPIDGILGADFLKEKKAVIDYNEMYLLINN